VRPALPRVHAITDERTAARRDLIPRAGELAAGGGELLAFHARGKALTGLQHLQLAQRLAARASNRPQLRLFVNDRLDIALAMAAEGVQLGRDGLSVADARRLEPRWWIGRSVHDLAEAEAALAEAADYLVVGPVFPTTTHPERAPLGLEVFGRIARLGLPAVAIGGVTPERAALVRAAGGYGVAAIGALWDARDASAAARAMVEAFA
jgi:thiamine-phosphate pyrophosphorylase